MQLFQIKFQIEMQQTEKAYQDQKHKKLCKKLFIFNYETFFAAQNPQKSQAKVLVVQNHVKFPQRHINEQLYLNIKETTVLTGFKTAEKAFSAFCLFNLIILVNKLAII